MPYGMVQLSPDTRIDGSWDGCSGYHYSDNLIYGFSHTHLNGTGVSDYGDIMLMPTMGEPSFDNKVYSSIGKGYLLLVGFTEGDNVETMTKMADKIMKLRVFPDENGKTNKSIFDVFCISKISKKSHSVARVL